VSIEPLAAIGLDGKDEGHREIERGARGQPLFAQVGAQALFHVGWESEVGSFRHLVGASYEASVAERDGPGDKSADQPHTGP
jgi:hypothetical protein